MNTELATTSNTNRVRRLRIVAAVALLSLAIGIALLGLVIPSFAQAGPSVIEAAGTIFVDEDATGTQTGDSWEHAYINLQDALHAISGGGGVEIWVAEGVYYPDEGGVQTDGDRTATYRLKPGVAIYGGFGGWEASVSERDWVNNVTVLSGDIDQNDENKDPNGVVTDPADLRGENSYHVVTAEDVMTAAKLDGFTITGGLANSDIEADDQKGAGISIRDAAPTLANLIIQGNKADGELIAGEPEGYGGGMHVFAGSPQSSNVLLRNNYARTSGGGLYTTDSAGGIANLRFEGNVAGATGGGMYATTDNAHSLSNLHFEDNSAAESGGGLYVQLSEVLSSLAGSTFTANTAVSGGGLYVDRSAFNLTSVQFTANAASDYGGGMFSLLSSYFLTGVTFDGNDAGSAGGGVYAYRNVGDVTASTFLNNTSVLGAGMYIDDHDDEDAILTMHSPLFLGNVASEDGGGLYVLDSPEGALDGVTFLNNGATAGNGGGMVLSSSVDFRLSDTDFDDNEALAGGGLYVDSSDATLTDVRFGENEATQNGGGMLSSGSGSYLELVGVAFTGNSAGGSGGGLSTASQNMTLVNMVFSGNTAGTGGGGLETASPNIEIINSTFSGNAAGGNGGGVSTTSPNLTIDNTVIWNNQDSSGIGEASASLSGAADSIDYSLIQGQNPIGTGNLDGNDPGNDPQFVIPVDLGAAPTASGNLRLKYGSPVVDMGDNLALPPGILVDLAGNTRIHNGIVDLGAYELQLACPATPTARLYVDHTASLGNSGTSWEYALKNLRDAFTLTADPDCEGIVEIWVAEGVYRPDEGEGIAPDSRTETYQLIDGVAVYGGFDGNELLLEERNWRSHTTVLSGDIDNNDINSGGIVLDPANINGANSYHVVTGGGTGNTAVLDGFVITAGQANDGSVEDGDLGAGLYNDASSPTLANLSFVGNTAGDGAGLANVNGSHPPMVSIRFDSNSAETSGGAIYNMDSSPTLSATILIENSASAGAAIYNLASSPTLTNTILSANTASEGAGLYNNDSNPSLINALLSGNSAGTGAAIYNTASNPALVNVTVTGNRASSSAGGMFNTNTSQPTVHNSIFWDNQDSSGTGTASATIHTEDAGSSSLINYSLVQALSGIEYTGANNLDENPWFTAPLDPSTAPSTAGDLTLGVFSPAIDVGDNAANSTLTDLDGSPRIINSIIDLGTYEAPYRPIYYTYLPMVLSSYP